MLESAYLTSVCRELDLRNIHFKHELGLPIEYKGIRLETGYRLDLLVDELVIVEIKSIDKIAPIHEAQLLTYLRLTNLWLGLLLNFNSLLMRHGIRRIVNG